MDARLTGVLGQAHLRAGLPHSALSTLTACYRTHWKIGGYQAHPHHENNFPLLSPLVFCACLQAESCRAVQKHI